MKVVTVGTSSITKTLINSMRHSGVEVFACVGRDLQRVQAFAEEMKVELYSNDYERVLQSKDFDTVYIAVPNRYHFNYAKKALEAKKNVILEKPLCSNFQEASELIKIALRNRVYLFENNKVPHNLMIKEIKKDLDKIGPLRAVEFNFSKYSSKYDKFKNNEYQSAFSLEECSGALLDLNIYNISFAISLFGMPKESLYLANKEKGVDISGVALMKYDNFVCNCTACKDCNPKNFVSIAGEKGSIYYEGTPSSIDNYTMIIDGKRDCREYKDSDLFAQNFRDYLSIVENNQKEKYEYYLKQTLMTLKVLDGLRKSANIVYPVDK